MKEVNHVPDQLNLNREESGWQQKPLATYLLMSFLHWWQKHMQVHIGLEDDPCSVDKYLRKLAKLNVYVQRSLDPAVRLARQYS
ncbi:hypothetical protein D3C80_2016220 [compost metagenome]